MEVIIAFGLGLVVAFGVAVYCRARPHSRAARALERAISALAGGGPGTPDR
jgi:hypothetical protein